MHARFLGCQVNGDFSDMIADSQALVQSIREEVTRRRREIESLDRVCLDRERRVQAEGENQQASASFPGFERVCLRSPEPPGRLHVRHLLRYYDRQFVDLAYRAILGRSMDAGSEWYVEQLREGQSRLEILLQLRSSEEGKRLRARVPGLAWRRLSYKLRRVPVIGWIYRPLQHVAEWFWCLATLPRLARDADSSRQHTTTLFNRVEEHLNDHCRRLEDAFGEYAAKLDERGTRGELEHVRRQLEQYVADLQVEIEEVHHKLRRQPEPASEDVDSPTGQGCDQIAELGSSQAHLGTGPPKASV
jgi:hypothetical protein